MNSLKDLYDKEFEILDGKIRKNEFSEVFVKVEMKVDPIIKKVNSEQLANVFTDERLKRLGLLLEFLRGDKQQRLISSLEVKYPGIPTHEIDGEKVLYLEQLDSYQLFDLLKLAKGMKSKDFDTAQLVNV